MISIKDKISNLICQFKVKFDFRTNQTSLWNETMIKARYIPTSYTNENIDYQLAYQEGKGGFWVDISLIIYLDVIPILIFPISISSDIKSDFSISSHGIPILPPLFVDNCSKKIRKKFTKICLEIIELIAQNFKIKSWKSCDPFTDEIAISEWHIECVRLGASAEIRYDLYLNISAEMDEIKRNFRKSYKPLINTGLRLWSVKILRDSETASEWKEFQLLHRRVSGRITRSSESWDMQFDQVKKGTGFLVYLKNKENKMIGGGLFTLSRDECVYSVGVYSRELFDYPLGHVVQYIAIEEMKRRNIKWYNIGCFCLKNDQYPVTEKEISISNFKKGFASHIFPSFWIAKSIDF